MSVWDVGLPGAAGGAEAEAGDEEAGGGGAEVAGRGVGGDHRGGAGGGDDGVFAGDEQVEVLRMEDEAAAAFGADGFPEVERVVFVLGHEVEEGAVAAGLPADEVSFGEVDAEEEAAGGDGGFVHASALAVAVFVDEAAGFVERDDFVGGEGLVAFGEAELGEGEATAD